ncbi:hypothetical protein [Streptomyces peucetius]|uniref:Uncharacterized protein n=1 Tax=Streptomyces peucetius TaxID=1950 RepID=A0ABY6IDC1_STRPE|nr:hypothetical protein [Streptomyces peucetius]UYQ65008.1 hypothetical protein OGH68_28485 [Streptomyces peucetius]
MPAEVSTDLIVTWSHLARKPHRRRGGEAAPRPPAGSSVLRRTESGGDALENRWNGAAARHYRAAEPSSLGKDVPLYTL